jgi:probable H4MPT-linked C1 transfer pathway protein
LAAAIAELLAVAPPAAGLAVTMTGELADCFATKREGVQAILDAVEAAARRHGTSRLAVRVYLTSGRLAAVEVARCDALRAAASNWHALARYVGRLAPHGTALLIDVGSTTTDLIPLVDGSPAPAGLTDPERLVSSELVYTGVQRSPVCALVNELPWRGAMCPVAQELFATTWDAYVTLGELPEEPENTCTADGRPATRTAARDRLARMICADRETFSMDDAVAAAQRVREAQLSLLVSAAQRVIAKVPPPCNTVIVSGAGEFLARELAVRVAATARRVSLVEQIGPGPSACAPAHALAVLAGEESPD